VRISKTKNLNRYHSPSIQKILPKLQDSKERLEFVLKSEVKENYKKFDKYNVEWKSIIECLSIFDCLLSLYKTSSKGNFNLCRPKFILSKNDIPIFGF
jgi:DNA mismatch repair ATPase MutS